MVKRKRMYLAVLLSMIFIGVLSICLSACGSRSGNGGEARLTPTGYPSEEVQRISVYYGGTLYWYTANGFDQPLAQGFEKVGEVKTVDNMEYPDEEFCGTRLDVGQEIYASSEDTSRVYVKYDSGYAMFETADVTGTGE